MRTGPRSIAVWSCVVLLGSAGALTACSGDGGSSSNSSGGEHVYHQGDSISVGNGDSFVIALDANPSTGYSWSAGDNANVDYVDSREVSSASGRPGAPGMQELTFKAVKNGHSTLDLAYSRPFEGGVPPAKTASFPVSVS